MIPSPASSIDHTLLKPETTSYQIAKLCEEAVEWGFAAVCVPPAFVAQSAELLYGSGISVATVVGFPFGYSASQSKAFETTLAVSQGAGEIDMVMAVGRALEGDWKTVSSDIREVVMASEGAPVKVILECSALDDDLKRHAADVAIEAGAAYLKTSTGYGASGATAEDVRFLCDVAAGRAQVKASGGIRTLEACLTMIAAGASRVGTSSGVTIMQQWQDMIRDRG